MEEIALNQHPRCGLHACFGPEFSLVYTANGIEDLCTVGLWVFECMWMCVSWENSYETGAQSLHLHPRHHLHRPFPACRLIPAPVLPPLPSHTYQPPAAVPLPESGSSSLDTVDRQQQLIHLSVSLSPFFSPVFLCFLKHSLGVFPRPTPTTLNYHLTSFPRVTCWWTALPRPPRLHSQGTFAQKSLVLYFSASQQSTPRVWFNFLNIRLWYSTDMLARSSTTPFPQFPLCPFSDGTDILFL